MVSKKYMLLAGFICLMASYGLAQVKTGGSYDPSDSSVVPTKRMPQHTEFLNGTYNFPAKPRNQWEIGVKGGAFTISGDVPAIFPTIGWGVHVRKALGYVFSLRLEYMNGTGKGLAWRYTENINKNTPWMDAGYVDPYAGGDAVFLNYKSKVQDLSLQGIITLNNIRFHKSKTGFNIYAIAGIGGSIYDTKLDILDGNGNPYNFSGIPQGVYKDRKDTRKAIKDLLDGEYETDAQNQGDRRPKLFGKTFKPSGTIGLGMAFKLSNRFNLAIEDRITIVKDDLLDGQQWQEHPGGNAALSPDYDSYNYATIGINYNLGAKSVEPLWWLNPLDYAYSEIRNPRLMKLPKPVLDDSDGDGVTDQFDLEQTPAGAPVDTRGVSRDTDGDGVPDYKDKELITPTQCQPVDADGVGKCPDPECCKNMVANQPDCAAKLGPLPSVTFRNNSNNLTDDAKAVLATVASRMRNNPDCKVVVVGYCASNKKEQQLSWDHVNKVISYLVDEQGVSADRFIFNYGNDGGDCNTVDLRGANEGEDGPNTVAPPHPNLRKK
ncbi:MAG: OmpA family protein [Chitinophagaceae bacterium]